MAMTNSMWLAYRLSSKSSIDRTLRKEGLLRRRNKRDSDSEGDGDGDGGVGRHSLVARWHITVPITP